MSIFVDKKIIQQKLIGRLEKIKSEVSLKGFRPGKVPASLIQKQFGKAIYGEVLDTILKESSAKAIEEKKIKISGQPKIDLKSFGEGKDLNYDLQLDLMPEIKLQNLDKIKYDNYKVKIDNKIVNEKLNDIKKNHKRFVDVDSSYFSKKGDQITFDYSATVDNKKFEGSEGKDIQIEIGKNLFIPGFDEKLLNIKKNETKEIETNLPSNYPKKELAGKKTLFSCKISNIKQPKESKLDDELSKSLGFKNLEDLKKNVENQISHQYQISLDTIAKKDILDKLEKSHSIEIPSHLIESELKLITQNLSNDDKEKNKQKNEKIAESRIKIGLILNEYAEKNNIKINEEEIKSYVEKQAKQMPGQENMIFDYYKKNPNALTGIRNLLYEEKIINFIKSKSISSIINITSSQAEELISSYNKKETEKSDNKKSKTTGKDKTKSKKISKK